MKHILIFILLTSAAFAQGNLDVRNYAAKYADISLYQYADSALIATIPAGAELRKITMICDTAFTGGETDSIKIGISGEGVPYNDSFRFGDLAHDSLSSGEAVMLSHSHYRQWGAGKLYLYDAEVDVDCPDVGTYYPVKNMRRFSFGIFDTSLTGSALIVPKYYDGWYEATVSISFSANKAATAQGEIFKNGATYEEIAFERTISTGSQYGNASASGGIYLQHMDSVGLYLKSSAVATNYTIHHAQLSITQFSDPEPYRTGGSPRDIMLYCGANTGRFRFIVEYVQY